MNREVFENIPNIKNHLEYFDVYYTNFGGYLYAKDNSSCHYINGAWMMYQEQQKKVEGVLQQLNTLKEHNWGEESDVMSQGASKAYQHSYWLLKAVLDE